MTKASVTGTPLPNRKKERGSVMIMTAILMGGLILALALCIDVARLYMLRTELQNAADAAALSAARELSSGAGGINDGVARATAIVNNYGFNDAVVNISAVNVEFAVNLNGPYVNSATAAAAPANYRFVRVTTDSVATPMLFSARVWGNPNRTETKSAVAGMSVGINTICDFFPFAVALADSNPSLPGFNPPAPNTVMTLNFTQGNGNSMTLADKDYVILEVPEISGNGAGETIRLSAGLTSICQTLNVNVPFHATPSSNQNNGPRQITDGVNTRFNIYANGPGQLNPTSFPPDSNIAQGISFQSYNDRTTVVAPSPNGPGVDQRRILVVPIVAPGTYTGAPVSAPTIQFGAFFLRSRPVVDNPCSQAAHGCARFEVEWIDERLVIGRGSFTPGGGTSNLTLPVLYQ
ncbi:MAG TPA: pilus assembly protein TadG-related protein [Pyrinomonadaceae bacterium]|nr:pilus assembly protein TadG-related protein [Pyrinomonadaceae bacterium]